MGQTIERATITDPPNRVQNAADEVNLLQYAPSNMVITIGGVMLAVKDPWAR